MFAFGPGVIVGTLAGATPTPINLVLAQEVTLDFAATNKPLYGQNRYAIAMGGGTVKVTGKVKAAKISAMALGLLFFGITPSAGQTATAIAEAGSVPAVSTYTITVANSATWTVDQGVVYATTGLPLKRVASVSAVGQYSVAAGVYTFYSGDASASVLITYNYTIPSTGSKILVPNPLLGAVVNFAINWYVQDPTTNLGTNWQLPNCVMGKYTFGSKLEDFVMPEFDFDAYANAAGNIAQINVADAA